MKLKEIIKNIKIKRKQKRKDEEKRKYYGWFK